MKSIIAVIFGFGFNLFIEGFARIIISFFHTLEPSFFGIEALPGTPWIISVYLVSIIATWLGAMMALTIAGFDPLKHLIAFMFLLTLWSAFEIVSSLYNSPAWYLFTFPITSFAGALLAYYTYQLNHKYANSSS